MSIVTYLTLVFLPLFPIWILQMKDLFISHGLLMVQTQFQQLSPQSGANVFLHLHGIANMITSFPCSMLTVLVLLFLMVISQSVMTFIKINSTQSLRPIVFNRSLLRTIHILMSMFNGMKHRMNGIRR